MNHTSRRIKFQTSAENSSKIFPFNLFVIRKILKRLGFEAVEEIDDKVRRIIDLWFRHKKRNSVCDNCGAWVVKNDYHTEDYWADDCCKKHAPF